MGGSIERRWEPGGLACEIRAEILFSATVPAAAQDDRFHVSGAAE
jgi:hypothetical protein